MFLCCQLNAFSVRLGLELGLGERPPLLCFQEGMSVVGCIAVCTHWTLDPILGLWPPQVWSQGPPPTLHCEAPLKLGHWDHHQPTSRVRFEKMSSILKWYLSDGAVWPSPAWQGWWCQQFGPNIILIYWHHPPALLQEHTICAGTIVHYVCLQLM